MGSSVPHSIEDHEPPEAARAALIAQLMPGLTAESSDEAHVFGDLANPAPARFIVECVEAPALVGYITAWSDLCRRAIEPNIFLEPSFAIPLFQHMPRAGRPSILLVWEESGAASFGRLLGLFPVAKSAGWALDGIVRGFWHEQTSCGVPLLDRDRGAATLEAILTWLAERGDGLDALTLTGMPRDGAFRSVLAATCALTGRALVTTEEHERAILRHQAPGTTPCRTSTKRRKERARQFRRLAEKGRRTYASAQTPDEIAAAAERFLALEHNGWKGARGTALLSTPGAATFFRTMTRLMAHDGQCRIDAIEIDCRPVAMGVVLSAGPNAYFWKTAFDESFAALSPGVQLAIELTGAQLADRTILSTDSCAVANHPMIDKLWPERLAIVDEIVALRPHASWRFNRSVMTDRLLRVARRIGKAGLRRLRGRD